MTAKYICIEGVDGCGKTTQVAKLYDYLTKRGHKVLATKEPGTHHSPVTLELRNIVLDAKWEDQLTDTSRELLLQAIRVIHLEKVIAPALATYDYIIQDRGLLSGLSYATARDKRIGYMAQDFSHRVCELIDRPTYGLYDKVIYLQSNNSTLNKAKQKQEYVAGDVMENRGEDFQLKVKDLMENNTFGLRPVTVNVDGKNEDEVLADIIKIIQGI